MYKHKLAAHLTERILIYGTSAEDNQIKYKLHKRIVKKFEAHILEIVSNHLIVCVINKVQLYQLSGDLEKEWIFDSRIFVDNSFHVPIQSHQMIQLLSVVPTIYPYLKKQQGKLQSLRLTKDDAEIYFAYSQVQSFIDEPFLPFLGFAYMLNIFNAALFAINKLGNSSNAVISTILQEKQVNSLNVRRQLVFAMKNQLYILFIILLQNLTFIQNIELKDSYRLE
ncbi:hypothetical protein ABPG73_003453 [Tetrahymena malaccensis]